MKKNFSVIFLVLGTIIGAGFCSGKEICVYFAKYGFWSLLFLPLFFVIYFFLFKMFLSLGRGKEYTDFSHFNKQFGKNNFFDFVLCCTYVVFSSAMFACLGEMSDLYFGQVGKIIMYIFAFVFTVFMLLKTFKSLKLVNVILIPVVLVCIITVCVVLLFCDSGNFVLTNIKASGLLFFTPIIYACQGLTLSYYILVKAGKDLTKKDANVISFTSSTILTVVLALAIIVFNLNPQVISQPMPFVILSFKLGFPFDLIYAVVLFFAIITTLLSSTRALYDYLARFIKKPFVNALVTSGITLLMSFFGFSSIVESLYPIIGCMGAVLVLRIWFSSKNKFFVSKGVKNKLH